MEEIELLCPEPAGEPELLFRRILDKRNYERKELIEILSDTEIKLDNIIEKLRNMEYSLVDYNLGIYSETSNKYMGEIMMGGFIVMEGYEHVIDRFEYKYKDNFKKINEKYDGSVIEAEMHVLAFRDTISKIVKARNPKI